MKIINYSNLEYNQIANATAEDWEQVRLLLLSSFDKKPTQETNTNIISIRILSDNEYTKYIKNSTLNGNFSYRNANYSYGYDFSSDNWVSSIGDYNTSTKVGHDPVRPDLALVLMQSPLRA